MNSPLGVFFALFSALCYGVGDFGGGLASRKLNSIKVLLYSALISLVVMASLGALSGEVLPSRSGIFYAALAGIFGGVGIVYLFRGLAIGKSAVVSPVSAVIAAVIPLIFTSFREGLPEILQLVGCVVALPGIWLVSTSAEKDPGGSSRTALGLAILAGFGFAGFFLAFGQIPPGGVFLPVAVAKVFGALTGLVMVVLWRLPLRGDRFTWYLLLPGILDALANLFYMLASHNTRLDIAAMLASLYPGITVLCSAIFLKERIRKPQWVGLGLCLMAMLLISS